MAYGLPGGTFVGIDLAPRQVEAGARRAAELGLANVSLRAGDLGAIDGSWGEFDYIVAHGVLSWVPAPVRRRLLEVGRERLAPGGVAFVSWNALPGWRFRGLVRELLLPAAAPGRGPAERARLARERLALVAAHVAEPGSPWGRYLAERAAELEFESDADLLHDYLEEENTPFAFREVVAAARDAGLDFLCDAQEAFVPEERPAPALRAALDALASDVEREELLDVLRERTFRQGLFVRAGELPRERPDPAAVVAALHAGAPPAGPDDAPEPDPSLAAALGALREEWPGTLPVARLLAGAGSPGGDGALAAGLLRLQRAGLVELRTEPFPWGAVSPVRPRASVLARLQAADGLRVSSLRHRNVALDDLAAGVLARLDGSRTLDEVAAASGHPAPVVRAVVARLREDSLLEA
jgi:SAM-dependent methyltransferase